VAILLGAAGLIVSEFLVLREIRAVTAALPGGTVTGGAHHHYALLVVGAALVPMGIGAGLRRARPAALACLVLGLVAAGIVVGADLPHINDPGIYAKTYDLAQARPMAGFYVESFATALVLVGSVAALVLGAGEGRRRARRREARAEPRAPRERAARREPAAAAAPERPAEPSPAAESSPAHEDDPAAELWAHDAPPEKPTPRD
jgi:hypothetical protein